MKETLENVAIETIKESGGDGGGLDSISPKYSKPIKTETGARSQISRQINSSIGCGVDLLLQFLHKVAYPRIVMAQ